MNHEIESAMGLHLRNRLLILLAVSFALFSMAGEGWAQEMSEDGLWTTESLSVSAYVDQPGPAVRFSASRVDEAALEGLLASAPLEGTTAEGVIMSVPMPDRSFEMIRIMESPILSPELERLYPGINTFIAQGVDDASMTGRLDRTPAGFHGMLISEKGTVYISPGIGSVYLSYWKEDALGEPLECSAHAELGPALLFPANNPSGDQLRTYRLAVSATGEYTQFFGGVANAAAQIATTINRVTGIYERDLTIRLNLVATNIYDDPTTDPFTGNNVEAMLDENQADLDVNVGDANYDVGHIFSQGGGGGVANQGVCVTTLKARGATSLANPSGDVFDVDYVSHEIGHQFSGSHTWNGNTGSCSAGQFVAHSAFEPGSGSTIMAYAGICTGQNVQSNSDDYFHVRSFDQITNYRDTGAGTCGSDSATGNTPPSVEAGANCTIPTSTPFRLTADGDDADGDALTYAWEQYDAGTRDGLPQSTFTSGPLFRSWDPVSSPTRVFPRFEDVLAGSSPTWEVLPSVNRTMNFRVTVRDNRAGGGGVDWDSMVVTVAGDPFGVTVPSAGATLECGDSEEIAWTVGGGSVAANVGILFSSDGGSNFSTLVASTANDGSHFVTAPKDLTAMGRFMLEPSSECFFAVSDQFSIADTLSPDLTAPPDITVECTSPDGTPVDLGEPEVSDLCDADVDVVNDAPDVFPVGTTPVLWTATDDSGNQSNDSQYVTVEDTIPPEIFCNSPATITPPDAPVSFTVTAEDICDAAPSVAITAYDCFTFTTKGKRIDKTDSCVVTFDGTTITILDSGGVDDHITWDVEASDIHGNQSTKTCEVLVVNPSD